MTAKQKAAREKFKAIIQEAKKLRAKNPKLTQAQAVKQAWAINKGSGKKVSGSSHKDTKSHNVNIRVVSGWTKGGTRMIEKNEAKIKNKKNVRVKRAEKKDLFSKPGTFQKFTTLSGFFDTSVIKELDDLKKQYFKLAKKYHPDAGGTTIQFQELQAEYDKLLNSLLRGSKLNEEQKQNEIVIDKAIRDIIDALINVEGINVELVGKWLWVSGNTYPVRTTLKSAGLIFIKKNGQPYWVYKGTESKGRGNMELEDIKRKYGVTKIDIPSTKKIGSVPNINKTKLKRSILKLKRALDKRPV